MKTSIESRLQKEWKIGYLLAVANIIRTHREDTIAEDVLRQYAPDGNIDWSGIDPMDRKILRPIAREIRRKRDL